MAVDWVQVQPQILPGIGEKLVPSKDLVLLLAPPDFQTFHRHFLVYSMYYFKLEFECFFHKNVLEASKTMAIRRKSNDSAEYCRLIKFFREKGILIFLPAHFII